MPRKASKKARSRSARSTRLARRAERLTEASLAHSGDPEAAAKSDNIARPEIEGIVIEGISCEEFCGRALRICDIMKVGNDEIEIDKSDHVSSSEQKHDSERNVSETSVTPMDFLNNINIIDSSYEGNENIEGENAPYTTTVGDMLKIYDSEDNEDILDIRSTDNGINNQDENKTNEKGVSAKTGEEDDDDDHVIPNLPNSAVDYNSDSDCSYYSDCDIEDERLCLETGRGVCVVSVAGAGDAAGQQFRLEEPALAALLARPGVAERRAVVVSVAGAFRGGKSFLLDFMLRYLYAQAGARGAPGEDWLGGEREPLRGFSWRNGSARDTTGLVLWSQPVPLTLPCGEQVVVLLMDTQGAFDEQSSLRDCSLVFALSTLLASVQIYNVSRRLDECDLQHLQLFTEYAALGGVVLQELQVLVRDWTAPYEFQFGATGGDAYLRHKLQVRNDQPCEARQVRQRLASSFERVGCFLMPHPGLKAASDHHFRGELADLTEEFKQSLRQLVPLLLAPERLRPKAVDGQPLRAGDLAVFLRAYLAEFRDRVPSPQTALAATAAARWATAAAAARAALCAPPPRRALPRAHLRAHLDAARCAALAPVAPLAERAQRIAELAQLQEELQALVERRVEANARAVELAAARARGGFERAARALLADAGLCLHPRDLPPLLRAARDAAAAGFDEDVESADEDTERAEFLEELEERIADVLPRLEAANAARNAAGVAAARAAAAGALAPRPCAPAAALRPAHDAARAAALAAFREARSAPTAHLDDPYLTQLEKEIDDLIRKHEMQNENNNTHQVYASLALYDLSIDLDRGCWERQDLLAKHKEVATRAKERFYANREGPNSQERDFYVEMLERSLDDRFNKLRQKNECLNESVVEEAFEVFRKTMNDSFVGFKDTPTELTRKLNAAFDEGIQAFFKRSVATRSRHGQADHYLNTLQEKMENEYGLYLESNKKKLTGGEAVVIGAVGAGALALGAVAASAAGGAGAALLGAAAAFLRR